MRRLVCWPVSFMSNQPRPLNWEEQSRQSFQTKMISRVYETLEMELKVQFVATNAKIAAMDTKISALERSCELNAHRSVQGRRLEII